MSVGLTVATGAGTVASSEKTDSTALRASGISARSVAPVRSSKSAAPTNTTTSNRFQCTSGQGSTAPSRRNPAIPIADRGTVDSRAVAQTGSNFCLLRNGSVV